MGVDQVQVHVVSLPFQDLVWVGVSLEVLRVQVLGVLVCLLTWVKLLDLAALLVAYFACLAFLEEV